MRQKTQNNRNQGSIDKKIRFFLLSLRHIPRWVRLVQKTRSKNSHAWAPLTTLSVCGKKPKTIKIRSQLIKKWIFWFSLQVIYLDGFTWCKKRERKFFFLSLEKYVGRTRNFICLHFNNYSKSGSEAENR